MSVTVALTIIVFLLCLTHHLYYILEFRHAERMKQLELDHIQLKELHT